MKSLLIVALLLAGPSIAEAAPKTNGDCAGSVKELGIATKWKETKADDGKPLKAVISNDGNGGMKYTVKKDGVIWLAGQVKACDGQILITKQTVGKDLQGYSGMIPNQLPVKANGNTMVIDGGMMKFQFTAQ